MGFHTDLQKLSVILRRNLFTENLINKYISKYIQTAILTTQCNELCKIARALNSTTISKYVTLKMTDVPSKHV